MKLNKKFSNTKKDHMIWCCDGEEIYHEKKLSLMDDPVKLNSIFKSGSYKKKWHFGYEMI